MLGLTYEVKTKTKIIDHGANNLFKQLEALNGSVITTGIHEPESGMVPTVKGRVLSKTPLGNYAFYNEYGKGTTPARPFLRLTVKNRQVQFLKESMTDMKRLTRQGLISKILKDNANKLTKWTKATVWNLRTPPNTPATLAIKKRYGAGSNPLIFSGLLRDSITSKVHKPTLPNTRKLRRIINKINKEVLSMKP